MSSIFFIRNHGGFMTIGEKIKKARQLRGWTQAELASIMDLPVSRIQQYEANIRSPKPSQAEIFAERLGVNVEFLSNHNIDTYNDVAHTLLELEETFGLSIEEQNGEHILKFKDRELTEFLKNWYTAKIKSNTSSQTLKNYELWKATYPLSVADEWHEKIKAKTKEQSEE